MWILQLFDFRFTWFKWKTFFEWTAFKELYFHSMVIETDACCEIKEKCKVLTLFVLSTKKSWMDSQIFEEWICMADQNFEQKFEKSSSWQLPSASFDFQLDQYSTHLLATEYHLLVFQPMNHPQSSGTLKPNTEDGWFNYCAALWIKSTLTKDFHSTSS